MGHGSPGAGLAPSSPAITPGITGPVVDAILEETGSERSGLVQSSGQGGGAPASGQNPAWLSQGMLAPPAEPVLTVTALPEASRAENTGLTGARGTAEGAMSVYPNHPGASQGYPAPYPQGYPPGYGPQNMPPGMAPGMVQGMAPGMAQPYYPNPSPGYPQGMPGQNPMTPQGVGNPAHGGAPGWQQQPYPYPPQTWQGQAPQPWPQQNPQPGLMHGAPQSLPWPYAQGPQGYGTQPYPGQWQQPQPPMAGTGGPHPSVQGQSSPMQVPFPGWPGGQAGVHPGQQHNPALNPSLNPSQLGGQNLAGQGMSGGQGPYPYPMPPINVVVQNTHTNNQVVQNPVHQNHVQQHQGPEVMAPPLMRTVTYGAQEPDILVKAHARTKVTAMLLALLLGWAGGQHFYLGRTWMGLLSLLFCWTPIPALIGIYQGLRYLMMSRDEFDRLYNYERRPASYQLPPG